MTMEEIYSGDLRTNVSGELDLDQRDKELIFREIRRLRAQIDAFASGDLVRADAIQGVIPPANGGSGTTQNVLGAVSIWVNAAGGVKTQGTVVVQNGNRTFGVTTTARDRAVIGVLDDASVAVGIDGHVRHNGYQSILNVQDAVAVGDLLVSSSTSGAAASVGTIPVPGVFAMALTAKVGAGAGTVAAYLFPALAGQLDAPIEISFSEGGTVLTAGIKADITVPYDATILSWRLLADQSGSIVFDIWRDVYANYPPTVADTIAGTDKPTIAGATKNENVGPLTNWGSTTLSKGETLRINVDSCATITRCNLTLGLRRR